MKKQIKQILKDALNKYAWPGGYPVFMITQDGAALCPDCVKKEIRTIIGAIRSADTRGGWFPAGTEINYEDASLYCAHCGNRIESAYAEDEATK